MFGAEGNVPPIRTSPVESIRILSSLFVVPPVRKLRYTSEAVALATLVAWIAAPPPSEKLYDTATALAVLSSPGLSITSFGLLILESVKKLVVIPPALVSVILPPPISTL